jgi:hypothetical protein
MDTPRQTGITTKQMTNAPRGAWYVWVNSQIYYPQALAKYLDRKDLAIISPSEFKKVAQMVLPSVKFVIDHAASVDCETEKMLKKRNQIY